MTITAYSVFLTMATVPYLFMAIPKWKCDFRRDQLLIHDSNDSILITSFQSAINSGNLTQNAKDAISERLDDLKNIVKSSNDKGFKKAHGEITKLLKNVVHGLEKEDKVSLANVKFENGWGSVKDYIHCQTYMDSSNKPNKILKFPKSSLLAKEKTIKDPETKIIEDPISADFKKTA